MYINQQKLTETALFDYYMVGSAHENKIYSVFPYYLAKEVYQNMIEAAGIIDGLLNRLIRKMLDEKNYLGLIIDDFEYKEEILGLDIGLPHLFWARFDTFQREDGSIFFSEFNYDKPCAQRETLMSNMQNPHNNPNIHFSRDFAVGFMKIWQDYKAGRFIKEGNSFAPDCSESYDAKQAAGRTLVAILVDPGHYEELHLAYLYIDLLKELDFEFLIVGARNLYVEGNSVKAFGKKVDIILRQFPTEFSEEINDYKEILNLYNQGRVLVLNDPRVILLQAKSLFAVLWQMALKKDEFLSEKERNTIMEKLPYTLLFDIRLADELRSNKDKYVIKAVLGRYSEEVYIGRMCTQDEWDETIDYVINSKKAHIVQDFCPIKKDRVLRFNGSCYEETDAYGNFGIYMVNGAYSGISLRLSEDYLSLDENVCIGAVGISDRTYKIIENHKKDTNEKWENINNTAAFMYGYTGGYTGWYRSFSLDYLSLQRDLYQELVSATEGIAGIFKKARDYVLENPEIICPVLGISDKLIELIKNELTNKLTFIGRFDWVMDKTGRLKLLEFNSETPAGLMESIVLSSLIRQELKIDKEDPNKNLSELIKNCFSDIIEDYKEAGSIQNIGFVTSNYSEDWYNTTIALDQVKQLPYNFFVGEISGITVEGCKIKLYGNDLDAIYRYYPLDWFEKDKYFDGVIAAMNNNTLSINPPSTIITQSKAFLALISELRNKGFYDAPEYILIDKYLPKTYLKPKKSFNGIFCAKPYFDREGNNVSFSFKKPFLNNEIKDYVYQEWIDIQSINIDIYSTINSSFDNVYPILGAYVVGEKFGGIYTRVGSSVTNKWAVYLPAYTEKI